MLRQPPDPRMWPPEPRNIPRKVTAKFLRKNISFKEFYLEVRRETHRKRKRERDAVFRMRLKFLIKRK